MSGDRDDDLRARFTALRAADGRRAPAFRPAPAQRPGRGALAWSGAALAASAAIALSFAWRDSSQVETEIVAPEIMLHVAAEMPTDFLLDDDASDVRRDAPRFATQSNDEVPFL